MATQRGVSISVKMIATSLLLVLSIVGLLGYTSTYYSRKAFDDAAHRLSEAYDSALESRAQVMTQTMAETVRPALIQNDWSNLKTLVPESAKSDSDVVALYIIADTSIVAAHSDVRLNEKPISEVEPKEAQALMQLTKPLSKEIEVVGASGAKEMRKLFARPVTAQGKKLGTLVVIYSTASLQRQLKAIEEERQAQAQNYMVQIALIGLVFILAGSGIAVFQGLRIARPLKALAARADQIARGDLSTRVEVDSPDEIGMLAENFNYMADQLQVLLAETAAKAVLEKELELASTIQETLVPSSEIIEHGPVKVAGHFQPATQCGGDWWAVHELPGDKVLVIIGDVTGHGVPAAMITAAAKAACDVGRLLEGARLTPSRLLELMNHAIFESARRKFVMTCFASIIDTRTRTISYANAGHNFPYLYRNPNSLQQGEAEFTVLMSRGNRLGDIPDSTFAESTQQLRAGDKLVFFTDGLIECENAANEEYGEKRLRLAIRQSADQPPKGMRDAMMQQAAQFYADRPRKDDITLVVAHIL
jgi:serine phosphatase RsbU (regulator of sigma subunit)